MIDTIDIYHSAKYWSIGGAAHIANSTYNPTPPDELPACLAETMMMAAEGLMPVYLSPYIEAHSHAYTGLLKAAQRRLEWQELIGFLSDAIVATVNELPTTRDALRRLGAIWRGRRKFRKDSSAERALDVLPHYPVLTIRRLSKLLDISVPAATTAVEQLIEAGILVERTGYARNRVFVTTDALTIVDRAFGEEAVLPEG
jgi:Fic family protein